MASIISRKLKNGISFYIAYRIKDANGQKVQRWFRCKDKKDAKLLLEDVEEAERANREFKRFEPSWNYADVSDLSGMTLSELVYKYADHHSRNKKWEAKSRKNAMSCIRNYIVPFIGSLPISKATTMILQTYYDDLPNHRAVKGNHKSDPPYISPRTVREVHKVLRPAFTLAKKWGLIDSNPTLDLELPKMEKYVREQWSGDEVMAALDACENEELELALSVMFSCTMRTGELLGLTWDCVEMSNHSISTDSAYVEVRRELARLSREDIEATKTKIYLEFPSFKPKAKTVTVLKTLKTESSQRIVYLPSALAQRLAEFKEKQEARKTDLGDEYRDYNLVFAQPNGLPHANSSFRKQFQKLISAANLRKVDLYSLRHSGATEKLRATQNLKALQLDMGHAGSDMVLDTYAVVPDEDRKKIASVINEKYFSSNRMKK